MKPLIFIDDKIPHIKGVLENFANVQYLPGDKIVSVGKKADALIIRTRTNCDAAFLRNSNIKYIATATIGTDHIDLDYCAANGIRVDSAPGCNACGVLQYVYTSLWAFSGYKKWPIEGKTIGVVGCGHVGSKVAALAPSLGFKVLMNDPPREEKEGPMGFVSLDYLLENSDIVTLHLPLDSSTFEIADSSFFKRMKKDSVFINASRGAVVCDRALIDARRKLGGIILDVWNNEPDIDTDVLEITDIATPHIAGYSAEGKINATEAVIRSTAAFFGFENLLNFTLPRPEAMDVNTNVENRENWRNTLDLILQDIFPIFELDKKLREGRKAFEALRSTYIYRREWTSCRLSAAVETCLPPNVKQAVFDKQYV